MANPMNPCDLGGTCDGASLLCQMRYAAATITCGPAPTGGVCDQPHHCSGTDSTCNVTYATGVVCRPAAGACDIAESCSGTSPACPPDAVEGGGTVCRASTTMCDPAESCDGVDTSCPPDVNCMAMPDGGAHDAGPPDTGPMPRDASQANDASQTNDAGTPNIDSGAAPPHPMGSCGCRAGARGDSMLALLALAFVVLGRRRRGARIA